MAVSLPFAAKPSFPRKEGGGSGGTVRPHRPATASRPRGLGHGTALHGLRRLITATFGLAALLGFAGSSPATARSAMDHAPAIEAVLVRGALESGAIAACAEGASGAEDLAMVRRFWQAELTSLDELLRENGFPPAFARELVVRFDLAAATPTFANPAQRAAFCRMVGDGAQRMQMYMTTVPTQEIRRILGQP
jgi:hypothetical protein